MFDTLEVYIATADEIAASTALVVSGESVKVHGVILVGDGSNALSIALHNDVNSSNASAIKVFVSANEAFSGTFDVFTPMMFANPVHFDKGISTNLTGNGGTAYIYYTK